ncbi:MAG: cysteine rich repeat-containing protein [Methylomonas sp.]
MKLKYLTLNSTIFIALALNACAEPSKKQALSPTALKGPVETFMQGCSAELNAYCNDVTPGENRLLACIYAHEDKLSGRCEYALFDASAQLERAVAALRYAADECEDDLEKFCANVEMGEGRLLACLDKNESVVSDRCKNARKDVGLKE